MSRIPSSMLLTLVVWISSGCSPSEEAVEAKDRAGPEAAATSEPDAAVTADEGEPAAAGPLNETAVAYMERREPGEPPQPGEAEPEAVGAIASCAVCHGPDGGGKPALDTPRIGGLPEWYLARQLKYFKAGVRAATEEDTHGTQMRAVAIQLSDAGIEDLAAHVAGMKPPPAPALDSGDAARGEQLYAVCAACHGPEGRGSAELNTPGLVAQSGEYLVRQLEHFRSGLRGSHPQDEFGRQMTPIVEATLQSRQDAVDVVSYIGSLRESRTAAR